MPCAQLTHPAYFNCTTYHHRILNFRLVNQVSYISLIIQTKQIALKALHAVHPEDFKTYDTAKIRENFLLDDLAAADELNFTYTQYDRMIVGLANPVSKPLNFENYSELKANYFLERREMGIINVGGDGAITADGQTFQLKKFDCLYIGKGVKELTFSSNSITSPAMFYLLSAPAHTPYPTRLMTMAEAAKVRAGDASTANLRTINKYIHLDGIKSCQLVMGLTILNDGSVWNTMPAHTHSRRMEAYFYFDLKAEQRIVHFMGKGDETRHIIIKNYDAVVSPPWSIHSGCGTASYNFIWGMAGENLDYTDMDALAITDLR
jgi:4-deoxy-L-threo-5-hexosulose-uronate ketol-isomerase